MSRPRTVRKILLQPLLAMLKFLTTQVEKLAGAVETQEPEPATNKPPILDKQAEKALHELRLMPSRWQKLIERPWLPWALLTPIALLFLLGLAQDTYLYFDFRREHGLSFRLWHAIYGLDVIYLSFAVLAMIIVWLYRRYSQSASSALRGLWDNGLLLAKVEEKTTDDPSSAAKFLRRYQAALESRLRFILLGAIIISVDFVLVTYIVTNFTLSFRSFMAATETLFLVCKWFVFPQLWMWLSLVIGWPMLITALHLRRLTEDFDLKVTPSHPDQCGGLKPIGDICLQLALIALVVSLVLGYWGAVGKALRASGVLPTTSSETQTEYMLNPTRESQPITQKLTNLGALACLVGGTGLFLYPVWGIHGDMKKKKDEFARKLAAAAAEFDQELEKAIKTRDEEQIKSAQSKLETLQNTYSLLQNYPEWPINREVSLKFFTPQLLSVVGLFINLNNEGLQTILEWLGLSSGA